MKLILFCCVTLFSVSAVAEEVPKFPEPNTVLESMKRAVSFYRTNLSYAGGYASSWSRDLKQAWAESDKSVPSQISIQPHGTTTVGLTMLEAYLETRDPLFLQGAKEAVCALNWCQLSSGGWNSDFDFSLPSARKRHFRRDLEAGDVEPGKRSARATLDDNKTQSAIQFLLAFANSPAGDEWPQARETLDFALDGLLAAQAPNGGWPQGYSGAADQTLPVKKASFPAEWPRVFFGEDYTKFYTLNDNNLEHVLKLLLEAHRLESENSERFLEAAKRLGNFLLLAQMPEPQPVWAQQYDLEMHPAWARKFEPPAVCSGESFGAMRILTELWLVTGDEKYIEPLPSAFAWFKKHRLKDENQPTWARFYELETNKPLYCQVGTYELTYDGAQENLPTHYGFKLSGGFEKKLERLEELIAKPRTEILEKRERDSRLPESEKEWSDRARKLADAAKDALRLQKKEGYWVAGDRIDAGEFVKRMRALNEYLDAAENGGETYAKIREAERKRVEEEARKKAEAQAAERAKNAEAK